MLLGLNGQIGSGKDTFYERALVLADQLPDIAPPERLAFADKLKDAFGALFGIDRETIEELKRDDGALVRLTSGTGSLNFDGGGRYVTEFTVRLGLQRMGTEVGRNIFGESFWVDQCVPLGLDHSARLIMVTDCRFPNEAQRIRDAGGFVVRVLNGPLNEDGHASEQILPADLIDFEVDNSIRGDNFASLDAAVTSVLQSAVEQSHARRHTHTIRPVGATLHGGAPDITRMPTHGATR